MSVFGVIGNEDGIPCVLCDGHSETEAEHNRHMEAVHGC